MESKYENLLDSGTRDVIQSFYDNFAKENGRFRQQAGFRVKVIREVLGECCDWCSDLEGVYDYDSAPSDVYARHKNCSCVVTTKTERGTYQDVWSKREYNSQRDARIARADELVKEIQRNKKITPEERAARIATIREDAGMLRFTTNDGDVIIVTNRQFGKKCGKHAVDFGLDPSTPEGRSGFENITESILQDYDEVRRGTWRMQENECDFYIKGDDVVVTSQGHYVTTLKDGVNNERIKNAGRR